MERVMKKKLRLKKHHIGVTPRIVMLLLFMMIFVIATIWCIQKALLTVTVHEFYYGERSKIDYKVCLNDNPHLPNRCLGKDDQEDRYVASMVDYIETDLKYNFEASNNFDYTYTYSVVASIVATDKSVQQGILYDTRKNPEVLTEEKTVVMNESTGFSISENVRIDYEKYNNIMNAFRQDYALTLNSILIITLQVNVVGEYDKIDDKISTTQTISLTVPLSEQTLNIEMDYKDNVDSKSMQKETNDDVVNKLFFITAGVNFFLAIVTLFFFIRFLKKITVSKSEYTKKLEKIMKEYNQIIVEAKNIPNFDNSKVFEIDSFEELLDVRETVVKPIMYVRINSQKTYFIIFNGEEIYRYILKEADL